MSQSKIDKLRPLLTSPEAYQGLKTVIVEMKQEAYLAAGQMAKAVVFNANLLDDHQRQIAMRFYGQAEALEKLEELLVALRK
jgi:hypothetical protein